MENLLESIRVATADGATDDLRTAGVAACRTILSMLEPCTETPASPGPTPQLPEIAAIVGALRGVPAEQLLDLAISRLRAALPKDAAPPVIAPVKFQLLPITPLAKPMGPTGGAP